MLNSKKPILGRLCRGPTTNENRRNENEKVDEREAQVAQRAKSKDGSVPSCPTGQTPLSKVHPLTCTGQCTTLQCTVQCTTALCVKPFRNLGIKNFPKWWPWLPFSQAGFISDKNIWMLSPLQFHFQSIFGYELKTVFCSSWIAKESVAIQTGCRKDVNQIEGTSWPEPLKNESKYFCFNPVYENIWKKIVYFKSKIHNEGVPGEFCYFLVFFCTWHEPYVVWIS